MSLPFWPNFIRLYLLLMNSDSQPQHLQTSIEGRWTLQEHHKFVAALMAYGKNWKLIQNQVETRNTSQVRSHAQKYFLKMIKIQKQRKRNIKKGISQSSKAQQEIVTALREHSITSETPSEIIHFLKLQLKPSAPVKQDLRKAANENMKQRGRKRTSQILQEMLDANEQQSFLVSLMQFLLDYRKHNKNFKGREQVFTELIDFPQINREENEEEETSNKRKKSFSLYEQEDDEKRYELMVKKMTGK